MARLKQHLIGIGASTAADHARAQQEIEDEVMAAQQEAERYGTLASGHVHDVSTMFDDVYKELPPHLRRQRDQQGA